MENIIDVTNLKKEFKTFKKEAGFLSAVKSLVKRDYVTVKALAGISFCVKKGDILGFIGPNGAGKSTTIKILSGILYPSSGNVTVRGFMPWKDREKYVRSIGVVFGQKQQLVADLPAIDTYNLYKALYEIPDESYNKNLEYFIRLLDVKELIRRPVRQLSLGEKMKCELIGSLLHEPDIVFLDEPTIGLDIISKEKVREFIKLVNRTKKTTFILTTHDFDDIENLCENILIINKGLIVFNGRITELKKEFVKTKIIEIQFTKKHKIKNLIDGLKIISHDDLQARIEVDLSKNKVQDVVNWLFSNCPVKDITLTNPEIEKIIKKIYEK